MAVRHSPFPNPIRGFNVDRNLSGCSILIPTFIAGSCLAFAFFGLYSSWTRSFCPENNQHCQISLKITGVALPAMVAVISGIWTHRHWQASN